MYSCHLWFLKTFLESTSMESGDTSKSGDAAAQIWDCFNKQRLSSTLCDAILKVGDQEFPVHRAILAANSPYFRALFTNGMRETEQKVVTIKLVTESTMEEILTYMYTREVNITAENVQTLLPQADSFMVQGLVEKCCDFLISSLTPKNCIGIMKFAQNYYRMEVAQEALRYIRREFENVAKTSPEFLTLEPEELLALISDDGLNVSSETAVWEASKHWIDYEASTRTDHLPHILSKIRLGRMEKDYFVGQICKHPYIMSNAACIPVIQNAWGFVNCQKKHSLPKETLSDPLFQPRVPEEVLFVIGGWSGGSPVSFLESYDSQADQWYAHPELEENSPRAYHGMAAVGGKIYIMGGFDGSTYYNHVKRFDPMKKTWQDVAPMYQQRCYVSATSADGKIYAIGGYDGRLRLDTAESYVPETNQWTQLAKMNFRRSDASAAAIQGIIYVVGGFDGDHCLHQAEVYNPELDQWTQISGMTYKRSGVSTNNFNDCLYAFGGFDGTSRLQTCEKFNPEHGKWEEIEQMTAPRSNFATAVLNGKIITIGGFNGNSTISTVDTYDPETDKWRKLRKANVPRSALKACVISGLPNVRYYTYYGYKGEKNVHSLKLD